MRDTPGKIIFLLLLCNSLIIHSLNATHIRAADIKAERVCGGGYTFKITVTAYLNSNSNTRFGADLGLYLGDGTFIDIPTTTATLRPDLGNSISVATFTTTYTYKLPGTYLISYIENHRNVGVLNIKNSGQVAYASFVQVVIDPIYGCNNLPLLSVPPVDRACSRATFFHNPGAYDVDGDSLSYEMSVPYGQNTVADYTNPTDKSFYLTNYTTANEEGNGPPSLNINALTGLITWDAPGRVGEYNIAFKVLEWRKDSSGKYVKLSTTTRDMQIVVEDCLNRRPELIIPNDTCVVAGTSIKKLIRGIDPDGDPVKIEVYSEILDLPTSKKPATYSPTPPAFVSSTPYAKLNLEWSTDCLHVRQQPYQVVFKITDNPSTGPRLVTFKTWDINIIAPAPVWTKTDLDVVHHYGVLGWEKYNCGDVKKIQVWRKVGSYTYTAGNCVIGLPRYSGYQLIAELNPSQTAYTDTNFGEGLSPGAEYCYRLIALVADTKSYASDEMCIGPVKADAPVITHVSVEKTSEIGNMRISWRSPLNINKKQFPEPYQYEVYRAKGFIGDSSIAKISGRIQDTTFVDREANTSEKVFNYRIVIYSKPEYSDSYIAVDTSAAASSVWLSATAGANKIELAWRDSVPWSNVIQARPYHLIYRSTGLAKENELVLIDSVNVIDNGFYYSDQKQIKSDQVYSYKILTQGTYGNPKIALQKNFSRLVSLYPKNNLLPCAPTISVHLMNCDEYIKTNTCTPGEMSNTIYWRPIFAAGCRVDIKAYKLYASSSADGEYKLIATVKDTFFIETGLSSYARCYKVSSVDGLGHESLPSDSVCNDNCPYYELPNVFTPNGDGCNDLFSVRYNDNDVKIGSTCAPGHTESCPRFVKSVSFNVFNRWGKEVYHSSDNSSIYIDWNGQDNHGNDLATGVYFYIADVTFDVLDPQAGEKEFKGWVHLIR